MPIGLPRTPDIEAESSNNESTKLTRPSGDREIGCRVKIVLTDTTHGQRKARRRQHEDEKHRACAAYQRFHVAMVKAAQTDELQLLGRDFERRDIYIEPPYEVESGFAWSPSYGDSGYKYNPLMQGLYGNPNARSIRPTQPYSGPLGYGYG